MSTRPASRGETMTVSRPLVRGVLAALAMAALAACASHPKTAPTTAQQQPYSQSEQPARAPSSAVESQQTGPLPGSEQDFVINAGDRVYFDFDQYAIRPDA